MKPFKLFINDELDIELIETFDIILSKLNNQ